MTIFGWIFMLLYWAGLTSLLIFCLTKTLKSPETE
jgi:hypothetical protein